MIITVTLNTGIDRILLVPYFKWNETIRTQEALVGMGGKATDASWVLGELGIENLALGLAAGSTGVQMEGMLHEKGVQTNFTWVEGETRTNTIIISCAGEGQSTLTANSLIVKPEHVDAFRDTYISALERADCVIIGGSLPAGVPLEFYTELVQLARQLGVPVVFDASGPELVSGLVGFPTMVKPNQSELEGLLNTSLRGLDDVYRAACSVRDQYGCIVVATLGSHGALAVNHSEAFYIEPPIVRVLNAAGAGDAILAGLAHSLASKMSLGDGLRLGFTAAAGVLMTYKTADCRREDVLQLLQQVQIRSYAP